MDNHMYADGRHGAMPMPVVGPQRGPANGAGPGDMMGFPPMGMPRSPPKNKNTQHVPCKFFLAGNCTAGRTCPFSHDIESTTRPVPCKYFARGGCKFGRKCALLHINSEGVVVNRPPAVNYQAGPFMSGMMPPMMPGPYTQPPPGLLSMQAQGLEQRPNGDGTGDFEHYQYGSRNGYDHPVDMTLTSASPTYGSPPSQDRLATSPPAKGLSVLDVPLPNSFDSNGISMAARNGPFASSMPSRFGLESPPSSLPRAAQLGNTALRDLHSSAFGNRGMDGVLASMGSSPPSGNDEPLTFAKRPLHSDRLRARQPVYSSSVGTRLPTTSFEYSDDEDGDSEREEDLLPASLRDLIPEGKSRRESRNRTEDETPAGFLSAARRTLSGHASDGKFSSLGSSPSRYNSTFMRSQSSSKADLEGLGHVGSPLRQSSLMSGAANGDGLASLSSPPRQASMSILTQELQRTKLDAQRQASSGATPPSMPQRTLSNGSNSRSSLDRGPSSTSVPRIDEEQEAMFYMEEVGAATPRSAPRSVPNGENGYGAIGAHRAAK